MRRPSARWIGAASVTLLALATVHVVHDARLPAYWWATGGWGSGVALAATTRLVTACPECDTSDVSARETIQPEWRCGVCDAEFDEPVVRTRKRSRRTVARHLMAGLEVRPAIERATVGVGGVEVGRKVVRLLLDHATLPFSPASAEIIESPVGDDDAETVERALDAWEAAASLPSLTHEQVEQVNERRGELADEFGLALPAVAKPGMEPEEVVESGGEFAEPEPEPEPSPGEADAPDEDDEAEAEEADPTEKVLGIVAALRENFGLSNIKVGNVESRTDLDPWAIKQALSELADEGYLESIGEWSGKATWRIVPSAVERIEPANIEVRIPDAHRVSGDDAGEPEAEAGGPEDDEPGGPPVPPGPADPEPSPPPAEAEAPDDDSGDERTCGCGFPRIPTGSGSMYCPRCEEPEQPAVAEVAEASD